MIISNLKRALGDGIAFSEGNRWKRKRKIISSVFNYKFVTSNLPNIIKLCN